MPTTSFTRSLINNSIAEAMAAFARFGVALPPWAFWSPADWADKGPDCDEIRDCMLGWDVTDFGSGGFDNIGRTLFTVRNGTTRKPGYPKTYAQKYLFDPEHQRAPAHFHRSKREDIRCLAVSSEVSSVCDDWNDNVFLASYGTRFPKIAEDEPRTHYLCHEYPALAPKPQHGKTGIACITTLATAGGVRVPAADRPANREPMNLMNGNVCGVCLVMLTPFRDDGRIDWAGLDALVEWYLAAGVMGLFAVCLSSEMYELTFEERVRLAAHVVQRAAGRVPVVAAGAFGDSIAAQAEAAQRIADTGVASVVLTVNQLAAEEEPDTIWQANTDAILAACGDIPLGLYECPVPHHRKLSPELLGWAAQTGRFLFLKDTCCDLALIRAKLVAIRGTQMGWYNAHCPSLLESLRLGGHGYSGIAANFYPELFVRLCAEFASQPAEAERLQRFLTLADGTIRYRYPASAKRWLGMQGLPIGETCRVSVPPQRPDEDERLMLENLREAVAELAPGCGSADLRRATRDLRRASRWSQVASPNQTTE